MDDRDRLAFYPFAVIRIACRLLAKGLLSTGAVAHDALRIVARGEKEDGQCKATSHYRDQSQGFRFDPVSEYGSATAPRK
jgi:hypothetical protein